MELMVAMTAGLIMLGAVMQTLQFFRQQFVAQQKTIAHNQDFRLGLEVMEMELRLASTGVPMAGSAISRADAEEVEFFANLNASRTVVTAPVTSGQEVVAVDDGSGWGKGKTVVVCWAEQCDTFSLAQEGHRHSLVANGPIIQSIPAGASVALINRVRYYNKTDERGISRILRMVDGGASVLIGDGAHARFSYWDSEGRAVNDPNRITRVVMELLDMQGRRVLSREVGVRL